MVYPVFVVSLGYRASPATRRGTVALRHKWTLPQGRNQTKWETCVVRSHASGWRAPMTKRTHWETNGLRPRNIILWLYTVVVLSVLLLLVALALLRYNIIVDWNRMKSRLAGDSFQQKSRTCVAGQKSTDSNNDNTSRHWHSRQHKNDAGAAGGPGSRRPLVSLPRELFEGICLTSGQYNLKEWPQRRQNKTYTKIKMADEADISEELYGYMETSNSIRPCHTFRQYARIIDANFSSMESANAITELDEMNV